MDRGERRSPLVSGWEMKGAAGVSGLGSTEEGRRR